MWWWSSSEYKNLALFGADCARIHGVWQRRWCILGMFAVTNIVRFKINHRNIVVQSLMWLVWMRDTKATNNNCVLKWLSLHQISVYSKNNLTKNFLHSFRTHHIIGRILLSNVSFYQTFFLRYQLPSGAKSRMWLTIVQIFHMSGMKASIPSLCSWNSKY